MMQVSSTRKLEKSENYVDQSKRQYPLNDAIQLGLDLLAAGKKIAADELYRQLKNKIKAYKDKKE